MNENESITKDENITENESHNTRRIKTDMSDEQRNKYNAMFLGLTSNEKLIFTFMVLHTYDGVPMLISADILTQVLNKQGNKISHGTVARLLKKLEYTKYIYTLNTKSYGCLYSVEPINISENTTTSIKVWI